jgi:hypothetical protein
LTFAKSGEGVGLTLKEAPFQLLSRLFRGEHLNEKELSDLAHNVAIMNEKELFEVREQAAESMRVRI